MSILETTILVHSIKRLQCFAMEQLPELENEVNALIARQEKRSIVIEYLLDILQSLTGLGVGIEPFEKLVKYYESVNENVVRKYKRL